MSLLLSTAQIITNIPGAYNSVTVQSSPVGVGASGIIVLIGESAGGPSLADDTATIINNSYAPNQFAAVQAKYLSGNIVEMMRGLGVPANDPDITNTASLVYIAKTNSGTQASSEVDTNYGILKDKNWGTPGNMYSYKILAVQAEVAPMVTGITIPSLSGTYGASFTAALNGGTPTVATVGSGPYTTGAQIAASITGLPSGVTASGTSVAPYTITLTVTADANANRKGYGKALELIDSTPGDLAALGLVPGLTVSSAEPEVELNTVRPDINANELLAVSANVALTVGYQGTTATATVTGTTFSTTVTGGSGASFSVQLSIVPTVQALANFINAQPGYTALALGNPALASTTLDEVTAIGINSTGAGLMPGRIKNAAYQWNLIVNTSRYLTFTQTALLGLPTATIGGYLFLTGGTLGGTSMAEILTALEEAQSIAVNFVVPLFAQDASLDIPLGLTDASSTYTIEAIHAAVKSHVLDMSQISMKRNREGMLAYEGTTGTYAATKNYAGLLSTYRCCLSFQDVVNVSGSTTGTTQFQAWYGAGLAAGMQSGGFYKAIVKKGVNIISFVDPEDFSSGDPGDVSDALNAGLLFLENSRKGPRWVSDQTTYGFDTNFVYNSLQTTYITDLIDLTFAQDAEDTFVGQSLADIDLGTVATFVTSEATDFRKQKLITASDDAPLGYKNVVLAENGPTLSIQVEWKPSSSIYFVYIQTNLSQVQRNS